MPSYFESSIGTRDAWKSAADLRSQWPRCLCVAPSHRVSFVWWNTQDSCVISHQGSTSCRWLAQATAWGWEGTRNRFVIALDAFACRFFIHKRTKYAQQVQDLWWRCEVHWSPTTTTALAYPKMSSLWQVANTARIACHSLRYLGLATYFYDFDVSCTYLRLSDQSAKWGFTQQFGGQRVVSCCHIGCDPAFRGLAYYSLLHSGSLSPNGRAAQSSAPHHSHSDQWMLGREMLR